MFIAIDIGGTKTRIAVSDNAEAFETPIKIDTPHSFTDGVDAIVSHAQTLAAGRSITAVAAGVAGPLTRDKQMLSNSPNLQDWIGKPLAQELKTRLSPQVHLENDSALVGLGEATKGAGQGYPIVAYLTVSTGVGGVRIVDGTIDRASFGFEPGHQVIDMDGTVAPFLGIEAEDLVSGTATEVRFGKKAYLVTEPGVWEELSRWVSYLVNNTVVHWSPDAVVLGGSMIVGDPAIPVDRIAAHLKEVLTIYPELPAIVPASLKDMGGIHGGFSYLRHLYKPTHE
jgi:glucokinase